MDKGALTAPCGYEMIYNGQPRWLKNGEPNPKREMALFRTYPADRYNENGALDK